MTNQQVPQDAEDLDYDGLILKGTSQFTNNFNEAFKSKYGRALMYLNKAIEMSPNIGRAYYEKGSLIAEYKMGLSGYFLPENWDEEDYIDIFECYLNSMKYNPFDHKSIRSFGALFGLNYEDYHLERVTVAKKNLTDDQIKRWVKVMEEVYLVDKFQEEDTDAFQELFELTEKMLFQYKNKSLFEFKLKFDEVMIKNDRRTSENKYKMDQALCYIELGDNEKAKVIYNEVLKEWPNYHKEENYEIFEKDHWKSPINRGPAPCLVRLEKLTKLDPNVALNFYSIGRILEFHYSKDLASAIKYYSKAASLIKDEDNFDWTTTCLFNLARLMSIQGMSQQALTVINRAQAIDNSDPKIGLEKGRILKSCGQVTAAFNEFERSYRLIDVVQENKKSVQELSEVILKEKEEMLRYFGAKIMQDQVDKIKDVLDYDNAAQMKKDMKKINSNKALKDYYDQFIFSFSSLYGTSQAIVVGQLVMDTGNTWVDLGAKAISMLPFYGDAIESIFSSVAEALIAADMKKKAKLFCLLAANQTEFDSTISFIARKIILNPIKQKRIIKASSAKEEKEPINEFWDKMNKFYSKFKSVAGFEDYNLRSNSLSAKLALKDTTEFISRLISNEKLLRLDGETRSDEIVDLFFEIEEEALEKANTKSKKGEVVVKSGGFSCFGGPKKARKELPEL